MTPDLKFENLKDSHARVLLEPEFCSDEDFDEGVQVGIVDATESYPGNGITVSFLTDRGLRLLEEACQIAKSLDLAAVIQLQVATGRNMNFFYPPHPMLQPSCGKLVLALWHRIQKNKESR